MKCPFCVKDGLPDDDEEVAANKLCMIKKDGGWTLKRKHSYFFQVQMQMAVCKVKFCDFSFYGQKKTLQ